MISLRHQIEIRPEVRTRETAKITRETAEMTTLLNLTPTELEVSRQKEPIKYQIINRRLTTKDRLTKWTRTGWSIRWVQEE